MCTVCKSPCDTQATLCDKNLETGFYSYEKQFVCYSCLNKVMQFCCVCERAILNTDERWVIDFQSPLSKGDVGGTIYVTFCSDGCWDVISQSFQTKMCPECEVSTMFQKEDGVCHVCQTKKNLVYKDKFASYKSKLIQKRKRYMRHSQLVIDSLWQKILKRR